MFRKTTKQKKTPTAPRTLGNRTVRLPVVVKGKRTKKEDALAITEAVCEYVATTRGLGLEDACADAGITARALYLWRDRYSEISEAIAAAHAAQKALWKGRRKELILNGVEKVLGGYEHVWNEVKMRPGPDGTPIPVEQVTKRKYHMPNAPALLRWLENNDPEFARTDHNDSFSNHVNIGKIQVVYAGNGSVPAPVRQEEEAVDPLRIGGNE